MALTNCTINSTTVSVPKDTALTSSVANQVLRITPDIGFVVAASDFTNNTSSSLSSPINSITLTNSTSANALDNEVLVTVDLKDSFVPTANLTTTIDIDGAATNAVLVKKNVAVQMTFDLGKATVDNTNTNSNISDIVGNTAFMFSRKFTANSTKFFTVEPSLSITSIDESMYTVTTSLTYDSTGVYVVAKQFNISVTIPSFDVPYPGELFAFTAKNTDSLPVDDGIDRVQNFVTNLSPMTDAIPTNRSVTVGGQPGAQTILTLSDGTKTYDFTSNTFTSAASSTSITLPTTGSVDFTITYPITAPSTGTTYTYTLNSNSFSGSDLDSNIDPDDNGIATFTTSQIGDLSYTISTASASNRSYTQHGSQVYSGAVNSVVAEAQQIKNFNLVVNDDLDIVLKRQPLLTDFTNTNIDGETGDSDMFLQSVGTATTDNSGNNKILTIPVEVTVTQFGEANSTSVLALDNFINTPPVATDVAPTSAPISVANNTAVNIQLAGTDADGDTITYSTTTPLPSKGTVAVNSTSGVAVYTPSGTSSNGADSFGFKVNDSLQDSASVTVNLNIAAAQSGGGSLFSISESYFYRDSSHPTNSTTEYPLATVFSGTATLTNATAGNSNDITIDVDNWNVNDTNAGVPSYMDQTADFDEVFYRIKNNSGTVVDHGTIVINYITSTFNNTTRAGQVQCNETTTGANNLATEAHTIEIVLVYRNNATT